jgi:hypothetical protein
MWISNVGGFTVVPIANGFSPQPSPRQTPTETVVVITSFALRGPKASLGVDLFLTNVTSAATFYDNYNLWIRTPLDFHMKYAEYGRTEKGSWTRFLAAHAKYLHWWWTRNMSICSIDLYFNWLCCITSYLVFSSRFVTQYNFHIL